MRSHGSHAWLPAVAGLALTLVGCAGPRPSELPSAPEWIVVTKSVRLPEWMQWYTRFAHHTWVDAKRGGEDAWVRVEVAGQRTGGELKPIDGVRAREDERWGRTVVVHGTIVGDRARRICAQLDAAAVKWGPRYKEGYEAYPGPNSNTFLRELVTEIPEYSVTFDHNALGRDYAGWGAARWASSGTGVNVETWPVGFTVAASEGLELHVLQLTFGLQFWPPRLELPFLPELP